MTNLLYASNEMFSSTQLVRKSKDIFDKLTSNKIDKAVILRDGKPNFMLLEFKKYENIMKEYEELKRNISINKHINKHIDEDISKYVTTVGENDNISMDDQISNEIIGDVKNSEESDTISKEEKELKATLAQIEALNLESELQKDSQDKSPAQIKEFWN